MLLCCLLVLSAGCAQFGATTATPEPSSGDGAFLPTVPGTADGVAATVVDVVDGDTVDVRYENGVTDTIRLLGIDTPEVSATNEPAEFEGVPENETGEACLLDAGEAATEALADRIAGETVSVVVDPAADRRDRYGRLLAYVEHGGTDLNYWLVETGRARVYDSTFSRSDAYYAAESAAQQAGDHAWACRTPGAITTAGDAEPTDGSAHTVEGTTPATPDVSRTSLAVERIHADAEGNDHENLGDEYVVFANRGDRPLDVGGWTVRDEAGASYTFPPGTAIPANDTLTLRTGPGTDTNGTVYWGHDGAVWNNGGDLVEVVDASGQVVLSVRYS